MRPVTQFQRLLSAEFEIRRARNARYSLRAYARQLGTDHSTLSQILRGRRTLTPRMVRRLGPALRLLQRRGEMERLIASGEFRADSRWCAARLGISVDEANIELQRLLRTGLLRMEGKRWDVL